MPMTWDPLGHFTQFHTNCLVPPCFTSGAHLQHQDSSKQGEAHVDWQVIHGKEVNSRHMDPLKIYFG